MKNESESFALFVGVDVSKSQLDVFLPDSKTRQVRDFAKGVGKDAKTDAIDAEVIATFGHVVKPEPVAAKTEAEEKLAALVPRRSQLLDLINQETNRLQQTRDREEIAKLVGVAPINRDSGTWKGQRFVIGGRAHVRRVLYMATLVATRCNEKIPCQVVSPQSLAPFRRASAKLQHHFRKHKNLEHPSPCLPKSRGFGGWPPRSM